MSDKYPYNHVDVVDFVTHSTAALHNQQGQAMANVINSLPMFKVDPSNAECYATIVAALAAADANLPAGASIFLKLAVGVTYTETPITLPSGRHVFIGCDALPTNAASNESLAVDSSKIVGNFVLPANVVATRRQFTLFNLDFKGNITAGSNWKINLDNLKFTKECEIGRTHGAAGVVVEISRCRNGGTAMVFGANEFVSGGIHVHDVDAPPSIMAGEVFVHDCHDMSLESVDPNGIFLFKGACRLRFVNNTLVLAVATNYSVIDCNNTACKIEWTNTKLWTKCVFSTNTIDLYKNCASAIVSYNRADFTFDADLTPSFVSSGVATETIQSLTCASFTIPTSAGCGTVWTDRTANKPRQLIYTGGSYPIWRDLSMPKYFVDGSATAGVGAYATIANAFAAANAELAAGEEVDITIADGTYATAVDFGTTRPIVLRAVTKNQAIISGALTFGAHAATEMKSVLDGVYLNAGTITLGDGRDLEIINGTVYTNLINWDPTGGVGGRLRMTMCRVHNPRVVELAGWSAGVLYVHLNSCTTWFDSNANVSFNTTHAYYKFSNLGTSLEMYGVSYWRVRTNSLFNLNSGSGCIYFENCNIEYRSPAVPVAWVTGGTNGLFYSSNTTFRAYDSASTLKVGVFSAAVEGEMHIIGALMPLEIPLPDTTAMFRATWLDTSGANGGALKIRTAGSYPIWRDLSKPKYFVDPDITDGNGAYRYVNDAYAAAHAEEPASKPLDIVLATGKLHTLNGTLTVDKTRDVFFYAMARGEDQAATSPPTTRIFGTITTPSAVDQPARKMLAFDNIQVKCTINGNGNWDINMSHCLLSSTINRTHTGGYPGGCMLHIAYCTNNAAEFNVVDADAAMIGMLAGVIVIGSQLYSLTTGVTFAGTGYVKLVNSVWDGSSSGVILINLASKADTQIEFINTTILATENTTIFGNIGAGNVAKWKDCRIHVGTGKTLTIGNLATNVGAPIVSADVAPTTPPAGTIWNDTSLKEILVWDGTNWRSGDVVRLDVKVNVGSAAAFFSVGSSVPSGAAALDAQLNLDKAITGAAGADRLALVDTTGSPNIWASTEALTKNSKASEVFAPLVRSIGDDLYLASMSGLVPAGTIAGSNSLDVRVVVRYRSPVALPNA
jgi:hypothetical protein